MAVDDAIGVSETTVLAAPAPVLEVVSGLATVGVGSLPHRDAAAAATFSMDAFDVLTLASLPRRSPAEAHVAQALVGTPGITMGQYGAVAIDVARLDPTATIRTELWRDAFTGLRACLDLAARTDHRGPVKWQFAGPISLGVTLRRAGAPADVAFALALRVVRSHLAALVRHVRAVLPSSPQLVILDEPLVRDLMAHDFPIAPDEAIDLLSSAMAVVEPHAAVGIHACGDVDIATLIAAGPKVLSIPPRGDLVAAAGYVARFLRSGGWVAWGAVPTEGPIAASPARSARHLREFWQELSDRGCDPEQLRSQSLISPQCGLGGHSTSVAERVIETTQAVAHALRPV